MWICMYVIIVFGINQGISIGLYYMKDVLKLQPSEAQFYSGIIGIPWIIKPLWGLMTDFVAIFRLRRRPYFIFAGILHFLLYTFELCCRFKTHTCFELILLARFDWKVKVIKLRWIQIIHIS
ncbi:putative biopterin transporter family [Helianthus anomalus]